MANVIRAVKIAAAKIQYERCMAFGTNPSSREDSQASMKNLLRLGNEYVNHAVLSPLDFLRISPSPRASGERVRVRGSTACKKTRVSSAYSFVPLFQITPHPFPPPKGARGGILFAEFRFVLA
jgi:hypothetical protein